MFTPKFLKTLLILALCVPSCRFWQSKTAATDAPLETVSVAEIKSEIPFATKEPEIYQTEIVVTANGVEELILTARNGANRLTTYDYRESFEFGYLQTGADTSFLIARKQKIYAENQTAENGAADEIFPTAALLNQKRAAIYEPLGAENGAAKYRVVIDGAVNSEIVVTVDKNINLPVKQEFYSVEGNRKTLISMTELRNFSLQSDPRNFELPKDYKKVSPPEFQEMLRRERMK